MTVNIYAERSSSGSATEDHTILANDALVLLSTAHELGYGTPATLTRYIDQGKLPVHRVGRNGWRKVRRSDLEALFHTVQSVKDREYSELKAHARRVAAQAPPCSPETLQEIVSVLTSGGQNHNE